MPLRRWGRIVKRCAEYTKDDNCLGAAKLVVFCMRLKTIHLWLVPSMDVGEADCVINVGVSGPGVVRAVLSKADKSFAYGSDCRFN